MLASGGTCAHFTRDLKLNLKEQPEMPGLSFNIYFVKTPMFKTFFVPAYGDTGNTYILCVAWLRCEVTKVYQEMM